VSGTGEADADGRRVLRRMTVSLDTGESVAFDKLVFIATGFETDDPHGVLEADLAALQGVGYDALRDEHVAAWVAFWADADVVVEGDPEAQAALRFCLYQNRIAARADADHLPLGARGLSCQAYQGAAFWDQEIYNLPAFLFTRPEIARNLLVYRWKTLDGARRKAARLGCRGAYFAWISGDTGDELCPTHFFKDVLTGRPIRTHFGDRQIHVSPDVVYAIWQYWRATGDLGFVRDHGAEIAFEVARFLRSWAYFHEERGRYEILRVLGPDEWHEDIDNNAYTNWIAAFALDQAVTIHRRLAREAPASLAALAERIGLDRAEVEAWADMAERLYRPAPDPETGLIAQFDGFWEQDYYAAGDGLPIYDTAAGRLGVVICYDRHFPESYRACARAGADVIATPTCIEAGEPLDLFEAEMRTLAYQNHVYAVLANRCGAEDGRRYAGRSLVTGPDGSVLARGGDGPEAVLADYDLKARATLAERSGFLGAS